MSSPDQHQHQHPNHRMLDMFFNMAAPLIQQVHRLDMKVSSHTHTRSCSIDSLSSSDTDTSLTATLSRLLVSDKHAKMENAVDDDDTSANNESHLDEYGRKKSNPIPIPSSTAHRGQGSQTPVGTPLTARGDLPSGYFPSYEQVVPAYKAHPFSRAPKTENTPEPQSKHKPVMSRKPSIADPMVRKNSTLHGYSTSAKHIETVIPMARGKYYPSNYKPPTCNTSPSTPSAAPKSFASTPSTTSTHLALPKAGRRKGKDSGHQRQSSDIKKKVREYQRGMIAEARKAASTTTRIPISDSSLTLCTSTTPVCKPLLRPMNSPGIVITPFELEESGGYMGAGERRHGDGHALGDGAQRADVQRMVRAEERRRDRASQSVSPMGRV